MCYEFDLVCVVNSLQPRTSSLRCEHASLRSLGTGPTRDQGKGRTRAQGKGTTTIFVMWGKMIWGGINPSHPSAKRLYYVLQSPAAKSSLREFRVQERQEMSMGSRSTKEDLSFASVRQRRLLPSSPPYAPTLSRSLNTSSGRHHPH